MTGTSEIQLKTRMNFHVFRQAPSPSQTLPRGNPAFPQWFPCPAVLQHRSALPVGCAVPNWNGNVPKVQLECCRSREQHPREPGEHHPHSRDLALFATGNYRSADVDELPGTHQAWDRGPGGSTVCKRERIFLTHQAR